jgi:hypothetical protein
MKKRIRDCRGNSDKRSPSGGARSGVSGNPISPQTTLYNPYFLILSCGGLGGCRDRRCARDSPGRAARRRRSAPARRLRPPRAVQLHDSMDSGEAPASAVFSPFLWEKVAGGRMRGWRASRQTRRHETEIRDQDSLRFAPGKRPPSPAPAGAPSPFRGGRGESRRRWREKEQQAATFRLQGFLRHFEWHSPAPSSSPPFPGPAMITLSGQLRASHD